MGTTLANQAVFPVQIISHLLNDLQGIGQMLRANLVKALQSVVTLAASIIAIVLPLTPAFAISLGKTGKRRKVL